MNRDFLPLSCILLAFVASAQQIDLNGQDYKELQFPLTEADTKAPFFYFNDEWIPGANIQTVPPEQIQGAQIKDDEYGNRSVFLTVSQETLDKIKADSKKKFINLDPICEFPGGNGNLIEWIKENIHIPSSLEGHVRVIAGMTIMPDGTVTDAKIIKPSTNDDANQEALRLVNALPKFNVKYCTPRKAPLRYLLPITFTSPGTILIR